MHGAAGADGLVPYLPAAVTHAGVEVIAESLIGPKINEVPEPLPLLRALDGWFPLVGRVVTVDAGLTARKIGAGIVAEFGAHYVMCTKEDSPNLYDAVCALDFDTPDVDAQTLDVGHRRRELRTIKVMDAPEHVKALYPHVHGQCEGGQQRLAVVEPQLRDERGELRTDDRHAVVGVPSIHPDVASCRVPTTTVHGRGARRSQ